ncbi:MAG: hypothetical protein A3E84_04020 [Gammaproteobacteria bacterium RIFCSPHIGHO2_12_FULL_42_13]|nr:MAG: hypothetical protein A3E84_04020 [Gammaproteobacteria bacterium RIFCSPHIGHO2_12_FULL_42_13]
MELSVREAVSRWISEGRRIAAASVVTIDGSSPHIEGLALVVNDAGKLAGAISGGCVDGEVVEACEQVLKTNTPQLLQFGPNKSLFDAASLVCGGKIEVWLYELSNEMVHALSLTPHKQCALSINWSDDRKQMQQLVVDNQTALAFTKCYDENVTSTPENQIGRAANFLLNDTRRTRLTVLTSGEKEFLERIGTRNLILIIGESAFTDMLCRLARLLDYEVIVCEPRQRFAEGIVFAHEVDESWPNECIEKLIAAKRLGPGSVIIVCTHDRKFDEPALLSAVRSSAGFIGALGSRRTIEDRRIRLLAAGLSELEMSRIRSPLGLDLGSETAAETAVSIFAEIIAARNERSGKPLRELSGTIHGKY